MRHNGYLYNQIIQDGGVDEYGEPIESKSYWEDAIACSIKTNSDNRLGKYEDGKFRQASFTILVEGAFEKPIQHVKLERQDDANLGEYDVMSVEFLSTVGRTKIIV